MPSNRYSSESTAIDMPAQRSHNPKIWHIATLAPGFDDTRLRFPILIATNDTSSKTLISSQSELDTLLKTHYGDAASNVPSTIPSSPPRNDSVVDLSTPSDKSPSNPVTDDYLTPLSSHFIDGELVCTGGLAIEHSESSDSSDASDSSDSLDYAKWLKRDGAEEVYGGDGRSFTVKLGARRWRRKSRVKKALSRLRRRLQFFGAV